MDKTSRSEALLNKVYDRLDAIDASKLSMRELEDFLGVVQKGRFLETVGQIPAFGFGGWPNGSTNPTDAGNAESAGE